MYKINNNMQHNVNNRNNFIAFQNHTLLLRNKILFDMQSNLLKKIPDLHNLEENNNSLKDNTEVVRVIQRPLRQALSESSESENIINRIIEFSNFKLIFENKKRLKIDNFLNANFAESLYNSSISEKNWILASGIDKNKYEKKHIPQNDKINQAQIKNVNNAFGKDQFSYAFYRSMNGEKMNYHEFTLRKILNSTEFISILNEITNLNLTKLNTLFMSKYVSGNFLSTHSDKGNGRLAFVINLSKNWKPQYGGNLHFLNEDRNEIIDTFVPGFNNLTIFYVPENTGIPHYVSHIAPNVKNQRFAISGWFE
jgi:Rps23 Pro-64 3,4-dihydroxylase Tpa1-like proline 4-hydroxylase